MGYQVYWHNGRWQGYGVPAYCDFPGCKIEIDRGMGFQHPDDAEHGSGVPEIFCCGEHMNTEIDLSTFEIERKEHPDWLRHVLSHDSWDKWRNGHPDSVEAMRNQLNEIEYGSP